ncbi:MAG TPA: DinB family protein [Candidatus Dormibacteraeota bacterium]|nr:DinB family protein [Candidatus Dormibacteraeota bacterium]
MSRDSDLADFDGARQEWEAAFGRVPDEALQYLRPGDDYALGGLQVHVNWVLLHYSRVLDGIIAKRFAPLEPQDSPGESDEVGRRAKAGMNPNERKRSLDEMGRLHAAVRGAASRLQAADWSRKAAVVYGAGQDPYPTSPEEILGWLRDHYREHVQQSAELVEEWRATAGG